MNRLAGLSALLLLATVVVWTAGWIVERRTRETLTASVLADARLRQALLASEIARFRLLPLTLADDRDLIAALGGAPGGTTALDLKLESLAARTGAAAIYVIGRGGRTLAASNWRTPQSFVGQDYRFRGYYADALRTGAGEQFALGTVSRKPGLYLTGRTAGGGVVVVKLEFDAIERTWRAAGGVTVVTDRVGTVLVTSRPGWRFARALPVADLGEGRVRIAGSGETMLLASTAPDASGWRVRLAVPAGRAIASVVNLTRLIVLLAILAFAAFLWAMRQRARRRTERTAALEDAVAARTADLTREIEERAAAEARAADLRDGLRQANRLATLGQITAGIAHETAQPVAAIRTYAATGEQFLDRGDVEQVRDNLHAIGRLTERIGAVTAELRGFSRKGSRPIGPVALADVIDGARLILKERLSRVALVLPDPPIGVQVIGGRVRLEQVLVNLLQNAIEATEGCPDPRVSIAVEIDAGMARMIVQDNGPGIAPDIAPQLFMPFVTSRSSGLGLGLVIAHDIMDDLGGALRLVPSPTGACFVIEMRVAP